VSNRLWLKGVAYSGDQKTRAVAQGGLGGGMTGQKNADTPRKKEGHIPGSGGGGTGLGREISYKSKGG